MQNPSARLESLTSLRFFAAALIVVHHMNGIRRPADGPIRLLHLEQGVSFFFVLSGFFLQLNYRRPVVERRLAYGEFMLRRWLRLWPAPALAVVLLCLAHCAPDEAQREYLAALRGDEDGSTRAEQFAHMDRAIELAPQRASYWEARAGYREDDLRFLDALADLGRAIELADRPYLRFRRGLLRCRLGQHSVALPDFDAAIAGQPENAQFFRGRALARVELGLVEGAMKDAETYFELAPQQGEARYVRGRVFAALARHREAVVEFDETLLIRPELIYPLFARAASLEALGERKLATADRERAEEQSRKSEFHPLYLDPFRY